MHWPGHVSGTVTHCSEGLLTQRDTVQARFCSQLMTMRGWEEDAFGHGNLSVSELAQLLALGGSTAAARHRMSVGRWATSSCSVLQLQRLPLAMYRRIAKEYAASLAGLLSTVSSHPLSSRMLQPASI